MVSISLRGIGHVFSGIIINPLWILTAAACIKELKRKQNEVAVLAGLNNAGRRHSGKQPVERKVARLIKRRGIDRSCIGLMKLSEPFAFEENIKRV